MTAPYEGDTIVGLGYPAVLIVALLVGIYTIPALVDAVRIALSLLRRD